MNQAKQEAISRMSEFQMRIKSLTVAVVTASLFVDSSSWFSIMIVLIILISLWILDAYYLSIERRIRFDKEVEDLGDRKPRKKETILNNITKKSVIIFHGTFVLVTILALLNSFYSWF